MLRLLTATAALALLAAPVSAQTIRIPVAGKTTAELHADIRTAAREVCWANYHAMPMPLDAYGACISGQVRAAKAQLRAGAPYAMLSTETVLR
jgi:hypothetical protein